MSKFFAPPVVYDRPLSYPPGTERRQPHPVDVSTNRLFARFGGQARGRSVLKLAGQYSTVETPDTNQIAAAEEYYAGGHVYVVTDATAAALVAAGYTVYDSAPGATVHGEALIPSGIDLPLEITTGVLTEASDYLLLETGDYLLQEA